MLRLAWKYNRLRPTRALVIVLAMAAVLAEILILEGFLAGTYAQLRAAVLRRGGDVMVTQSGVRNFLATRSVLPQRTRAAVEALPGVAATHPLAALGVIYEQDARLSPIILMVFDDAGGPARMAAGRAPLAEREIAIDVSLAQRYGLAPGDTLTLSDYEFSVSGISRGSAALFTPFAFITFDGLIDFYFESDVADDIAAFPLLSFLAVDAAPGADPAQLAARITASVEDAQGLLPRDLARNDENMGRELLGPILNLLRGLSYAIGAMVIGMFTFTAIRSRRRSLGVLRALGFSTRHLLAGVMAEAVAAALLAIPLAMLLALALAALIEAAAPVYLIEVLQPGAVLRTAAIALLLAVLGALAPLRMLMRLDPATAFRE